MKGYFMKRVRSKGNNTRKTNNSHASSLTGKPNLVKELPRSSRQRSRIARLSSFKEYAKSKGWEIIEERSHSALVKTQSGEIKIVQKAHSIRRKPRACYQPSAPKDPCSNKRAIPQLTFNPPHSPRPDLKPRPNPAPNPKPPTNEN